MTEKDEPLRVSASSNPQAVASAIAHAIYENHKVNLRAVGAGAVNQAVKAVAVASGFVAPRGIRIAVIPGFASIKSHDGDISAIVLHVFVL